MRSAREQIHSVEDNVFRLVAERIKWRVRDRVGIHTWGRIEECIWWRIWWCVGNLVQERDGQRVDDEER